MQMLDRLENAIDTLLDQNRHLKAENSSLSAEKVVWQKEKVHMIEELDRILNRIDSAQLEEP